MTRQEGRPRASRGGDPSLYEGGLSVARVAPSRAIDLHRLGARIDPFAAPPRGWRAHFFDANGCDGLVSAGGNPAGFDTVIEDVIAAMPAWAAVHDRVIIHNRGPAEDVAHFIRPAPVWAHWLAQLAYVSEAEMSEVEAEVELDTHMAAAIEEPSAHTVVNGAGGQGRPAAVIAA